jgi:hypothetical protein
MYTEQLNVLNDLLFIIPLAILFALGFIAGQQR